MNGNGHGGADGNGRKQKVHSALRHSALRLREWISLVLPLWIERAQQSDGRWVEHLHLTGVPDLSADRRWRVMTRQAVSYAQGTLAGFYDGPLIAERSFETDGRRVGPGTMWCTALADGAVTDGRHDLYDHAFALLACGRMLQLTGPSDYHDKAKAVMAYLDRQPDPAGGGREGTVKRLPRRQNPHMHLLEHRIHKPLAASQ